MQDDSYLLKIITIYALIILALWWYNLGIFQNL